MGKGTVDLIGQKFGKLTVISRASNTPNGKRRWICLCDCGKIKEKPVTSNDLSSGKVRSCGCIYKESNKGINKTHGMTHTRLYRIWCSMNQRCSYPKNISFRNYGGRGVAVCDEWLHDFQAFYDWSMANGYKDNLTIDRINGDGNYCPSNCRWVDMKTQQNNRRNNRSVLYSGVKYTISQLAHKLSIPYATLLWRINNGWGQAEWTIEPNLNNKNIRSKAI